MTPDHGPLYQVSLPTELLSRGTGEEIPAREATAFDVMPQALGGMFMNSPELRRRIHFWGDHIGLSFWGCKETYASHASRLLARGDLEGCLDAYKRSLHYHLEFSGGIASLQHLWLLNSEEVERLDVGERHGNKFSPLELRLLQAVGRQDTFFDPKVYAEFIREIRQLEKRRLQLNQLFWGGRSRAYEEIIAPGPKDPSLGKEYIDLCEKIGHFRTAARIAEEMGDIEAQAKYEELAKIQPEDSEELKAIIEQARNEYNPDRYR